MDQTVTELLSEKELQGKIILLQYLEVAQVEGELIVFYNYDIKRLGLELQPVSTARSRVHAQKCNKLLQNRVRIFKTKSYRTIHLFEFLMENQYGGKMGYSWNSGNCRYIRTEWENREKMLLS